VGEIKQFDGDYPFFRGFDMRGIMYHDVLVATFSHLMYPSANIKHGLHRLALKYFKFNETSHKMYSSESEILVLRTDNITTSLTHSDKNWIPFIYKDRLYFIRDLSNMFVVEYLSSKLSDKATIFRTAAADDNENDDEKKFDFMRYPYQYVANVSMYSNCAMAMEEMWGRYYGSPRGSTQAFPLQYNGDRYYLLIYHSYLMKHGRQYSAGALLFEGKPPFKPAFMSLYPIVIADLTNLRDVPKYEEDRRRGIYFPMNFFYYDATTQRDLLPSEVPVVGKSQSDSKSFSKDGVKETLVDGNNDNIFLMLCTGIYDQSGMIWKIHLRALLKSLHSISCN